MNDVAIVLQQMSKNIIGCLDENNKLVAINNALKFYELTRDPKYLEVAKRLNGEHVKGPFDDAFSDNDKVGPVTQTTTSMLR